MPWSRRSADARDHCSISRLSPRLCLDLSRVDDGARQVNAPVVDERQDGGHVLISKNLPAELMSRHNP